MATAGKKKIAEIGRVNLVHEILEDFLGDDANFLEDAPDMWDNDQKHIYDLANVLSDRTKAKIIEILNRKPNKRSSTDD